MAAPSHYLYRVATVDSRCGQCNLQARVCNGRFHRDLYYRLNTTQLDLPPSRDRLEDLEDLVLAALQCPPANSKAS